MPPETSSACAISRLGKSAQTPESEIFDGCGAEKAATSTDSTEATIMGLVTGSCESTMVGCTMTPLTTADVTVIVSCATWTTSQTEACLVSDRGSLEIVALLRNSGGSDWVCLGASFL